MMGDYLMRIVFNSDVEGGFDIVPTNDKNITKQFTDYETGYLIIYEGNALDPSDDLIYCTIVDPNTGKIIETRTRLVQIDSNEKVLTDETGNLKLIIRRSIDLTTGMEFLHQELFDLKSGQKTMVSNGLAFSDKKEDDLITKHYKIDEEVKEFEKYWDKEYATYSQDEKKTFWYQYFRSAIRQQGSYGDHYAIFDHKNYAEWYRHEPNIDRFLEYVIDALVEDKEKEEIRKRFKN